MNYYFLNRFSGAKGVRSSTCLLNRWALSLQHLQLAAICGAIKECVELIGSNRREKLREHCHFRVPI